MTADLANSISVVLERQGFDVTCEDEVHVAARLRNGNNVNLVLRLLPGFPYELPEFRLDQGMFQEYGKLPHVAPTGVVCAFDRETNIPNPSNPEGQVIEVLEKTLDILSDGVEGKNLDDFLDEFLAYWGYGQDYMLPLYSLVEGLNESPRTLYVYSPEEEHLHLFICGSRENAASLAKRLGDTRADPCVLPCAYIPLKSPIGYPFPRTHESWYRVIHEDGDNLTFYQRFLQKSDKSKTVIIFSCPYPDGRRVFAAFGHAGLPHVKGFRVGKVPLKVAMAEIGKEEAVRYDFKDACRSRLYSRGGNGEVLDMKACVIGCGSLGSHLVDALRDCGVNDFLLVDNQLLEIGNIARHLCGFSDIGKPKVSAVRDRLVSDNPNIVCATFSENAHTMLEKSPESLNSADCVFVTAGAYPLERHVVEKMKDGSIETKVVLMWVEPYAIAAHALVLNDPQDVQAKLFDERGRFKNTVVANGDALFKREAGCQATFVQYSGLDVKSFVIGFARELVFGNLADHNYHFAWYGALSHAEKYGAEINSRHAQKVDYSTEIQRID